ncbi:helix-turn-helix domain-containing protein [Myroides sp. LJL115]
MGKLSEEDIRLRDAIKNRISRIMQDKDFSKSALAAHNEKDRQTIDRWTNLSNSRGVSIYTIKNFCMNMKISMDEFFNDPLFDEFNSKI